jgi:hypothetical protein
MIEFQYYPAKINDCKPKGFISLDKFINLTKNPPDKIKELFQQIAEASREGNDTLKAELKKKLFKFTPCAIVKDWRKYDNITSFTGLLILDFDKLETHEAHTLKNSLFDNLDFVIASWLSPSKKGVKALINIPISKDVNEFKSYFKSIQNNLGSAKGFDSSAQNPILDCFLSYDPDILYRTDATKWTEQYFEPVKVRKEAPLLIEDKTDVIAKIIIKNLNDITNAGHPILRAVSYSLGGYVGAGYISQTDALFLIEGCIENHWYLKTNANTYKKTAKTMIEKGILEPLYLDELPKPNEFNELKEAPPKNEPFYIRVLESDYSIYGLGEDAEYYFTPEQRNDIQEKSEHLPVSSLLIQNHEEHFKILKFGYKLEDEPIKPEPENTTVNDLILSKQAFEVIDKKLFLKTHKKAIESDMIPKYKDLFIQRLKDYNERTSANEN